MAKQVVSTQDAPQAIGPYSQAIKTGNLVYTAGVVAFDLETGQLIDGDITAQTELVMKSLGAVLAAAGSSYDRVIKTTCFLANLDDFAAFNEVYGRHFGDNPPARSTVQVARLPAGALVEVEAVAECD